MFSIEIFDTRSNEITERLGITEDRVDSLVDEMNELFSKVEDYTQILDIIIPKCHSLNEVVYISFVCGNHSGRTDNPLSSLLRQILRH